MKKSLNPFNFTIFVSTGIVDADGDGIDDNWEILHFRDLQMANSSSDYDKDGYTDLQEYLNGVALETDPVGREYDSKVENAPDGTGYNAHSSSSAFWNLVLPAIIGGKVHDIH